MEQTNPAISYIRVPGDRKTVLSNGSIAESTAWRKFPGNTWISITESLQFLDNQELPLMLHTEVPKGTIWVNRSYNDRLKSHGDPFLTGRCWLPECGDVYCIYYGRLHQPGNRFSLLHEMGHANTSTPDDLEEIDELHELLTEYFEEAEEKSRKRPNKKEIMILWNGSTTPRPVPYAEWMHFHTLRATLERSAWSWALQRITAYRRQGFDLEPDLPDAASLHAYIYQRPEIALGKYEKDLRDQQVTCSVVGLYAR